MEQHYLQLTMPADEQRLPDCPPIEVVILQFLQLFASEKAQQAGCKAKASMVRDLIAIFEAKDYQWLLGGCHANATRLPIMLKDLVVVLNSYAAPPQEDSEGGKSPSGKDTVYDAAADRAADAGLVFCSILAKVEMAKGAETLNSVTVSSALHQVAGPMYIFAVTHAAKKPWSRPRTRSIAQELLDNLLRALGCQSVPEFLRGACEGEGWFAEVMLCLKPELAKETWQRSPATKHVFSGMLQQVTRPWLGHHLEKVLSPSLLLSDDYRVENKILGVQCLHHIICNVPAADLRQFNRAQVVYHALFNHLYSKEAQLMEVVLPCLLDLLPVLERAPQQLSCKAQVSRPSDKMFQLILTHMEAEHQLPLRRVYAKNLPAFINRFGIRVVRHLKKLQQVITGYLEVYDGPEESARLATLEALKHTIQHAWPRMSCRLTVLLRALLRMMWDVATDSSLTPDPVTAALLQGATECLLLLDHCSQGKVKILLQGIYHNCQEKRLKDCLQKVQEPSQSFPPLV